ncbi:MAG: hypothetical protein IT372_19465 [Polyangiaceae bacterium]|nr:hypothetical protein [Polyangiaceae bacterium]
MSDWGPVKQIDDPQKIEKIRALEQDLGGIVVVLEPKLELAKLSKEQMDRLRAVERDLSVVLVAYDTGYERRPPQREGEQKKE